MRLTRFVTAAALATVLGLSGAQAQIAETQPAEFPPASYKGKQYVDSQGCVFIRAGIDGDVSWIPRVNRARKTICGFTPTLGAQAAAAEPVAPAPVEKPVEITIADPAPAPAPRPRTVRRPATVAPVVVRQTAPRRAAKPVVIAPVPAAPVAPSAGAVRLRGTPACPNASAVSQRYIRGTARSPVRCGPQAEPIVAPPRSAYAGRGADAPRVKITSTTRIVPKHVAINRLNTTDVTVPRGYKRVWEDGRLNPKRAEQNLAGRGQMLLIWTNTVPRRLINQSSGTDVTASVPLVYPYLDVATQSRELGEVTIVRRDGQLVKRVVRKPGARPLLREPTYSSRSAPKAQSPAPTRKVRATANATGRSSSSYVQIGLFTTRAKAQRAARHLSGQGMAARMGTVRRNGKRYTVVQAGPFNSNAGTQRAVKRLRSMGYNGAVVR